MNRPRFGAYQRVTTQDRLVVSSNQLLWNRNGVYPVGTVARGVPQGS